MAEIMANLGDFFSLVAEEEKKKKIELETKLQKALAEQEVIGTLSKLMSQLAENKPEIPEDEILDAEIVSEQVVVSTEQVASKTLVEIVEANLGLIGGTTTAKTVDPLTPLDQKFVTFDDLQKHYKTYIARIQQQMSTMGGGGEVNFRYLDDVNRGTMNVGNDNWVLEYDAATKKAQFTENVGPIKTLRLNTVGRDIDSVPGMVSWNTNEDCMDIRQGDASTLQVGLETYVRVRNETASQLNESRVVRLAGISNDGLGTPLANLMTADSSDNDPLFLIGVLTNNIPVGEYGRATIIGKVRTLDTTGSEVGETWSLGDILWVNQTLPGKMTNVKPTAPDLAISIAIVTILDPLVGELLVRPNFAPRLHYGSFKNSTDIIAADINTPYNIPMDVTIRQRGFELTGVSDSRVTCEVSGLYTFAATYHITSTNAATKDIFFWIRKNGIDFPFSTHRKSISGNGTLDTFSTTWSVSLLSGEYVQLMWATTNTTVSLTASPAIAFAPSSPSVSLVVTQPAL
jgi:hypothetical protein